MSPPTSSLSSSPSLLCNGSLNHAQPTWLLGKFGEAGRQQRCDGYATLMEPEAVAELIESTLKDDVPSFHNPIGAYATEQATARFRDPTDLFHIEAKQDLLKQMGLSQILTGEISRAVVTPLAEDDQEPSPLRSMALAAAATSHLLPSSSPPLGGRLSTLQSAFVCG